MLYGSPFLPLGWLFHENPSGGKHQKGCSNLNPVCCRGEQKMAELLWKTVWLLKTFNTFRKWSRNLQEMAEHSHSQRHYSHSGYHTETNQLSINKWRNKQDEVKPQQRTLFVSKRKGLGSCYYKAVLGCSQLPVAPALGRANASGFCRYLHCTQMHTHSPTLTHMHTIFKMIN